MRILFAGSPAIAVPSLKIISNLEMENKGVVLAGLLTNPDTPRGRRRGTLTQNSPTDVSAAALELDKERIEKGFLPITQIKSERLDSAARDIVAGLSPDLLVSFAYGRIFGPRFLALFPLGGINIHPSLLPKYRGASPIPAAILAREKETGICIQTLAAEMDSGGILAAERLPLTGRETALSLSETVSRRAALLLRALLLDFDNRTAQPQEGEPVYCSLLAKEDGKIDWNKSALEIDAQIRAYTPWPLCFTRRGQDTLYILEAEVFEGPAPAVIPAPSIIIEKKAPGTVLAMDKARGILIQTGNGILAVKRLQWEAKKALDWKAFCNGARDFIGSRLMQYVCSLILPPITRYR